MPYVVIPKKSRSTVAQKAPYGLQAIESCVSCSMVKERLFCNLPQPVLESLDAISTPFACPKGAFLFVEGQVPRGVFLICNGRVKLSANSAQGKVLIVRIVEAGELIGVPGSIVGEPYEVTAEALEPIQANFIPREDFVHFLQEHGEAALRVTEILCHIYQATFREIRYLGLSGSAAAKLARFLLDRAGSESHDNGSLRAALTLTHEKMAEIIGVSRETVTRLFTSFKKKRFIQVHGSTLIITSKAGLEKLVEPQARHPVPPV